MLDTTAALDQAATPSYLKADMISGIRLDRQIGSGATSSVFLAHDEQDPKKKYAVKILSPFLVMQEAPRKRWDREVSVLIQLDHPNIVRGYRHGVVEGRPFLVMEFLQGETLMDRLQRKGQLKEKEVYHVARTVLEALCAGQELGILHRDIKPANLLWTNDDTIKVMDYGLAKFKDDAGMTTTGAIVGTPIYVSPEQAAGETVLTVQTDLYSLGVTLFHLATGRPPFTELNTSLLLTRKITDDLPDARTIDQNISPPLAYLIRKLSARDRMDRPETPEKALTLLGQLERGELTTSDIIPEAKNALAPLRPVSKSQVPVGNFVLDTMTGDEQLETVPIFLRPGEVLFYEDDNSRECYVLMSGAVEIIKSGRRIAELEEPGSFIGEMSPLNDVPRSATVVARDDVILLRITESDFTEFFSRRPEMALALARTLAKRLDKTSDDLNETNSKLANAGRLIRELSAIMGARS